MLPQQPHRQRSCQRGGKSEWRQKMPSAPEEGNPGLKLEWGGAVTSRQQKGCTSLACEEDAAGESIGYDHAAPTYHRRPGRFGVSRIDTHVKLQ